MLQYFIKPAVETQLIEILKESFLKICQNVSIKRNTINEEVIMT
jgi:hypothetical protein